MSNETFHCLKISNYQAKTMLDLIDPIKPYAIKINMQEVIDQLQIICNLPAPEPSQQNTPKENKK